MVTLWSLCISVYFFTLDRARLALSVCKQMWDSYLSYCLTSGKKNKKCWQWNVLVYPKVKFRSVKPADTLTNRVKHAKNEVWSEDSLSRSSAVAMDSSWLEVRGAGWVAVMVCLFLFALQPPRPTPPAAWGSTEHGPQAPSYTPTPMT